MSVLALMLQQETGGGPVEKIARTFGVDWPHLTAQFISFAIVCAALYWLAYQPVLRMLEARRQQIALGQANAEKINAALANIESQRQSVMAEAQAQSARLIADAREIAKRLQEQETQRSVADRRADPAEGARGRRAGARTHARRVATRSRPPGGSDHDRRRRQSADPGRRDGDWRRKLPDTSRRRRPGRSE